jgi:signal transduction histidine kinase
MDGSGAIDITAAAVDADDEAATAAEQATGPTMLITISDNGPGIPAEVIDRIFSPFFTTKPQGSGLGLAIVRKIVDAHDGRIDVGGRPGGGTVFRVTLPVRNQQQLFG